MSGHPTAYLELALRDIVGRLEAASAIAHELKRDKVLPANASLLSVARFAVAETLEHVQAARSEVR